LGNAFAFVGQSALACEQAEDVVCGSHRAMVQPLRDGLMTNEMLATSNIHLIVIKVSW
jgi:TPP-dependent pyruvate/acetoin dehydrogenase alpha subunit